jgi:hypothetical protein
MKKKVNEISLSADRAKKIANMRRLQAGVSTLKGVASPHGDDVRRHADDATRYEKKAALASRYANRKREKEKGQNVVPFREEFDGGEEYNDEVGMVKNNLHTLMRATKGLHNMLEPNENMPEWVQEKIAAAKGMLVAAWDYMLSQHEEGNVYTNEAAKTPAKTHPWRGSKAIADKNRAKTEKKKSPPVSESTRRIEKSLMEDLQNFKKNT